MVKEIKYVQIDTKSFIDLCNENKSLKKEIALLEAHVEKLQHSSHRLAGENRKLKSRANVDEDLREWRFRENLTEDITSFDSVVKENISLKQENKELKEKLSS